VAGCREYGANIWQKENKTMSDMYANLTEAQKEALKNCKS
jgi:hypothetical protein